MSSGKYDRKDALYQKAKSEGYRSRAAYKLIELDKKHKLLQNAQSIVDLGCAPGGWLQVLSRLAPKGAKIVGIDRAVTEEIKDGAAKSKPLILTGDFLEEETQQKVRDICGGSVDVVVSDLSPDMSGIYFRDAARSAELVELVFEFAGQVLKVGGSVVAKVFPGAESDELFNRYRPWFKKITRENLDSTRKTSKEMYFVALGYKGTARN